MKYKPKFQCPNKYPIHYFLSADTSFKVLALIHFNIRHLQIFIPCFFQRAVILGREIIQKKYMSAIFPIRNPYMKFQNDISLPNTCMHVDTHTYGQPENNIHPTFSKLAA